MMLGFAVILRQAMASCILEGSAMMMDLAAGPTMMLDSAAGSAKMLDFAAAAFEKMRCFLFTVFAWPSTFTVPLDLICFPGSWIVYFGAGQRTRR